VFVDYQTIVTLLPEMILVALATWIYIGSTLTRSRTWWAMFAVATYLVAAFALSQQYPPTEFRTGPLSADALAYLVRWLALLVGLLFTLIAAGTAGRELAGEYLGTLMLVVVGVMLVASANELVFLFVALELISIPTYVLLFLGRRDRATGEATAKYFFLSILSSAILLYGFSFLYGIAGSTYLPDMHAALAATDAEPSAKSFLSFAPIALVLIVAGLGFKIAAVPFHFYAPDVYQGTTNANAGLLAVAPKIAGVVALVRLVAYAMPAAGEFAWQLTMVLAMLTMTIGNICALWQQNMRRLMAYSSIAHGGYMLLGLSAGLAAPESGGLAAMLFYLLVYVLASVGTFAALALLSNEQRELNDVDALAGLARNRPVVAGAIAIFMFSLAGIPPLAGFMGKFALFTSAIRVATGTSSLAFTALAIVGAVNAAIAAAYYLRVVSVMYFRAPVKEDHPADASGSWVAMMACAVLVVAVGIVPGPVADHVGFAEESVQQAKNRRTQSTPSAHTGSANSAPQAAIVSVGRRADLPRDEGKQTRVPANRPR
jgi:NADH-quinone oxidoreductase subunit N